MRGASLLFISTRDEMAMGARLATNSVDSSANDVLNAVGAQTTGKE